MTRIVTAHGVGEHVGTRTERGRTSYQVQGPGFKVWVDATKARIVEAEATGAGPAGDPMFSVVFTPDRFMDPHAMMHGGGNPEGDFISGSKAFNHNPAWNVNEDNSTVLPYDPTPQVDATTVPGRDGTIPPGEYEIDPKQRLSPSDSRTQSDRRSPFSYPGPDPKLFAAGRHELDDDLTSPDEFATVVRGDYPGHHLPEDEWPQGGRHHAGLLCPDCAEFHKVAYAGGPTPQGENPRDFPGQGRDPAAGAPKLRPSDEPVYPFDKVSPSGQTTHEMGEGDDPDWYSCPDCGAWHNPFRHMKNRRRVRPPGSDDIYQPSYSKGAGRHNAPFMTDPKDLVPHYPVMDASDWLAANPPEDHPDYVEPPAPGPRHRAAGLHSAPPRPDQVDLVPHTALPELIDDADDPEGNRRVMKWDQVGPTQGGQHRAPSQSIWDRLRGGSHISAQELGLSDKYADITAGYNPDPFQRDPMAYLQRRAAVMDQTAHTPRVGAEMDLVLADKQIRKAAWRDVVAKAKALRSQGRVQITSSSPEATYARVQGDNAEYDTIIVRGNVFDLGGQSVTAWHCDCPWGQWAFKRKLTYVGRMCSHAYATYMQMQSLHDEPGKGVRQVPRRHRQRAAGVVEDFKGWCKDNDQEPDATSMNNFITRPRSEDEDEDEPPLSADEVSQLYDYVNKNLKQSPQREFDVPYTFDPDKVYKSADALRMTPWSITPELQFVPEGEPEHFVDVTKDERKTTAPDNMVRQGSEGHYDDYDHAHNDFEHQEEHEDPEIEHFASRYADTEKVNNPTPGGPSNPRPDAGASTRDLNKLRDLVAEPTEDHFGDMRDYNDDVRDLVDDLHDAGVDASPIAASLHFTAGGDDDFLQPAEGGGAFAGSGPDPKWWMSTSEDYVNENERPNFQDVTTFPDGDILKYNDSEGPVTSPRGREAANEIPALSEDDSSTVGGAGGGAEAGPPGVSRQQYMPSGPAILPQAYRRQADAISYNTDPGSVATPETAPLDSAEMSGGAPEIQPSDDMSMMTGSRYFNGELGDLGLDHSVGDLVDGSDPSTTQGMGGGTPGAQIPQDPNTKGGYGGGPDVPGYYSSGMDKAGARYFKGDGLSGLLGEGGGLGDLGGAIGKGLKGLGLGGGGGGLGGGLGSPGGPGMGGGLGGGLGEALGKGLQGLGLGGGSGKGMGGGTPGAQAPMNPSTSAGGGQGGSHAPNSIGEDVPGFDGFDTGAGDQHSPGGLGGGINHMGPGGGGANHMGPAGGAGGDYTVKPGDDLWDIAKDHGVDVNSLSSPSGDPNLIHPGDQIHIPGGGGAQGAGAGSLDFAPPGGGFSGGAGAGDMTSPGGGPYGAPGDTVRMNPGQTFSNRRQRVSMEGRPSILDSINRRRQRMAYDTTTLPPGWGDVPAEDDDEDPFPKIPGEDQVQKLIPHLPKIPGMGGGDGAEGAEGAEAGAAEELPLVVAGRQQDSWPTDNSDIVRQFHATQGAQAFGRGGGGGARPSARAAAMGQYSGGAAGGRNRFSNDDIAGAAASFLQRTAGRTYSMAEQQALMDEQPVGGPGARNLGGLDLRGTHYVD